MEVSVLGFGGAWIGDSSVSKDQVARLLNAALDAGLNVIDTASVYGESEEKIGATVSHRRDEFLLFSKCGEAEGLEGNDWEPEVVRQSVERSLKRLKTDRLDLLTIHTCGLDVLKQGDVIEAVERAKEEGKTRFIAYSGDNEALAYAVDTGRFDAVMTSVNVADQVNLPVVERAVENGLGVIAKRPIANGAWIEEPKPDDYGRPYWERLKELQYPALDVGIALRWTLAQPVHTAIVGTTVPEQWQQDADLLAGGPLPIEAVESITARWREVAPKDWIGLT
jgi:hypothetical protein